MSRPMRRCANASCSLPRVINDEDTAHHRTTTWPAALHSLLMVKTANAGTSLPPKAVETR